MTAKQSKKSFAARYEELQKLVEWFEKDSVDLEEAIEKFEAGTKLVKELKVELGSMENTIKDLRSLIE